MGRKKTSATATEKAKHDTRPNRSGIPLNVWLDDDLRKAIDAAAVKHRRTLREEVSIALEQYLEALGLWSPPEPPESD